MPLIEYTLDHDTLINCDEPLASVNIEYDEDLLDLNWVNEIIPDSNQIVIDTSGIYYFTLTDQNECVEVDSVIIQDDFNYPDPQVLLDTIDCITQQAEIIVNDTSNLLTVSWTNDLGEIFLGDTLISQRAGTYYLYVEGSNGCIEFDTIQIESSEDFPTINIESDHILNCNFNTANLLSMSDQTDLEYQWFDSSNQIIGTTENIEVDESGIYSVEVTNSMGCTSYTSFELNEDYTIPIVDPISNGILDCNNPVFNANANITGQYESVIWSGSSFSSSEENVEINTPGNYNLEVIGINGCSTIQSFDIEIDTISPGAELTEIPVLDCNHSSVTPIIQLDDPNTEVAWSGPNFSAIGSLAEINNPGEYQLHLLGNNGCQTSLSFDVIADYELPQFEVNASPITCKDSVSIIDFNILSDYSSIEFTQANVNQVSEFIFETKEEGILQVIVIGENGCSESKEIEIDIDTTTLSFSLLSDLINCNLDPVTIQVTQLSGDYPAFIYDENFSYLGELNQTQISYAGTYNVQLENENGCLSTRNIEIEAVEEYPIINPFDMSRAECSNAINLTNFNIEGGTPPLIIHVDGINLGTPPETIFLEGEGWHNITVTDSNLCSVDTSIFIEPLEFLEVSIIPEIELKEDVQTELELSINLSAEDIASIH